MSEAFPSVRFAKQVWLTNHAIESMAKRNITLLEIKKLIKEGEYNAKDDTCGWISHNFESRADNAICVAVIIKQAIVVKTIMVNWKRWINP